LVLGQLGLFHLLPVLGLGAAAGLAAGGATWRRHSGAAAAPAATSRWRAVDGPAVLVLAALLYGPGYDVTMLGSDGTVYLGAGAHLARTGALAVDDPLLRRLPTLVQVRLFKPYGFGPGVPIARSPSGLVYSDFAPPVYSTFSQLPSVWLGLGFAAAGLHGLLLATPLLAAAGMMAFYLLVRRLAGVATGLLAVALLAPSAPQILFARMTLGECVAQFFLWAGLLACSRWHETRAGSTAVAAGVGLGLAGLARPEYVALVPVAAALHRLGGGARWPLAGATVAVALFLHAALLVVYVVPSHYRLAVSAVLDEGWGAAGHLTGRAAGIGALGGALLVGAILLAWRARRHPMGARIRMLLGMLGVVAWGLVYGQLSASHAQGQTLGWLPLYTGWPVLVLAAAGLPLLVWQWWGEPGGRLALLVSLAAAAHFLYDPHTGPQAMWAARRLVPAALPLLFACAATALVAVARWQRAIAGVLVAAALITNLLPVRSLWGRSYYRGTGEVVGKIASLFPPQATVLIDQGLEPMLLDVPLFLIHGLSAVQLRQYAGDIGTVLPVILELRKFGDHPLYLLRPSLLGPPPDAPPILHYELEGSGEYQLAVPGYEGADGQPGALGLWVSAFRVVLTPPPNAAP
jgi:hypothetical protein